MTFPAAITRALRKTEKLLSTPTFGWKNVTIPCTPSSLQRGIEIMVGGNPVEIGLTLFVRLSNFLTADSTLITVDSDLYTADNDKPVPVTGQIVTYPGNDPGTRYRVLSAKLAAGGSHVVLHLADQHSSRNA